MTHRAQLTASPTRAPARIRTQALGRLLTYEGLLRWCYASFVLLSLIYGLTTPVFEASDESRHFAVIDYIRRTGTLPVQRPGEESPWLQEGSQPPLYYFLAIAATFWIDTSDLPQVLRYNPHAFIGQPSAQDNRNLVLHSERESFPWRGTALAVHVIRLMGAVMGLGALLCVTAIAREAAPGREDIALGATALVAFNPMYLFVTGSVNNDNLTILFGVLALLLSLRMWREGVSLRRAVWLGAVIGASLLAKVGGLALIPLALAALAAAAWRDRKWRAAILAGAAILALAGVIAGWWYVRNKQLYGEWLGLWTMSLQATQRPGAPVSLIELLPEWQGFRYSYWGVFGAFNVVLPDWLYRAYDLLLVMAAIGLVWEVAPRLRRPGRLDLRRVIQDYHDMVPLALIALQVAVTMTGIIRWTSLTKASQGRLLFPAMGGIATLLMVGLARWIRPDRSQAASALLSFALFAVAAAIPFTVIAPAYVPPEPVSEAEIPAEARIPAIRLGDQVELLAMQTSPERVQPGDVWEITIWWRAIAPVRGDYVAFAHVRGRDQVKLGEVNRYPAGGWLAASAWRVGDIWRESFRITIPLAAITPTLIQAEVGLYDVAAQENLRAVGEDGGVIHRIVAGQAKLARPEQPPLTPDSAPSAIRFGDHIFLASMALDPDPPAVAPGQPLTITLTWGADGRPSRAYTVFVHLVGENGANLAQADGQPIGAQYPTSVWDAGERITDPHVMLIPPVAAPGSYRLRVGLYVLETGERLPVLDANGQILSDHVEWSQPILIK